MSNSLYRPLNFGVSEVIVEHQDDVQYVRAAMALDAYAQHMGERFKHWAETTPDATLVARRAPRGHPDEQTEWVQVSYAQAYAQARSIGQALLNTGLGKDTPIVLLSENSIEHLLMSLGAMLVGVPYCSVSTAYSLLSQDYDKLKHIANTLKPKLVFAQDERYARAIDAVFGNSIPLVQVSAFACQAKAWSFADFSRTPATSQVDTAFASITADHTVKYLFTSGSTKLPKGVINTHRMWCANQQQMRQSMPVLMEETPVLVDWLPWNHTFGGNHNIGLVLYNGGTLYIDDGKPVAALIGETLRNLKDIAPTLYFNV
ncbi:MAG: hypothetical protein RLZZ502_736, partial [Pseudomonadota bacterium]